MITKDTARRIWSCYDEIERGKKLSNDLNLIIEEQIPQTPDFLGRGNVEMGIPTGDRSHKILRVAPSLALSVTKADIAKKEAELVEANEQARLELSQD